MQLEIEKFSNLISLNMIVTEYFLFLYIYDKGVSL